MQRVVFAISEVIHVIHAIYCVDYREESVKKVKHNLQYRGSVMTCHSKCIYKYLKPNYALSKKNLYYNSIVLKI